MGFVYGALSLLLPPVGLVLGIALPLRDKPEDRARGGWCLAMVAVAALLYDGFETHYFLNFSSLLLGAIQPR